MSNDEARKRLAQLRRLMRDSKAPQRLRAETPGLLSSTAYQARLAEAIEEMDRGERPPVPESLRGEHGKN